MDQGKPKQDSSFDIMINLRQLADGGDHAWGTSFDNVRTIGAPETGNGGLVQLWSLGGGMHMHISNALGYRLRFRFTLSGPPSDARFRWTLSDDAGSVYHEFPVAADGKVDFTTHPVKTATGVFGMSQVPETVVSGHWWQVRDIRIAASKP